MRILVIILLAISVNCADVVAQYKARIERSNGSTKWGKIYLKKGNKILYRIVHVDHVEKGRIKQITETSFILRGGKEVLIREIQMIKFMFPLEKALGYGFGAPIFALGLSNIIYPIAESTSGKQSPQFLTSAALVIIGTGLIATSFLMIFQKHQFDVPSRWRIVIEKKKKDKS